MLYTDRDFVIVDDLIALDGDVADVAEVEKIQLEGDGGIIHQAVEECANMLLSKFQSFNYSWSFDTGASNIALSAIVDNTPPPRIRIGQVAVDSTATSYGSPLKRYVAYLALRNFYQVASNRKTEDKYTAKVEQLQKDIDQKYWLQLKRSGLPVVLYPVPCPGAMYELYQGSWNENNVSAVAGSGDGGTFDVAITWKTDGAESGPSEIVTIAVDENQVISVDISSLNPPPGVVSWNLFVGDQGGTMYLQNTVEIGTKTYMLSTDPVLSGAVMGRGQNADTNLTFINLFSRG